MPTERSDSRPPSSEQGSLASLQRHMAGMYLEKDSRRGLDGTFMYLVSEVGELAQALRDGVGRDEEFADTLAWLLSVANLAGVDLQNAFEQRYLKCPHCGLDPCVCQSKIGRAHV